MKNRPAKKPSGAMYRRFNSLEAKVFLKCVEIEAASRARSDQLDSRLRAVAARLTILEDETTRRINETVKAWAEHERAFLQRLAEAEGLIAALTDRVKLHDHEPPPFGMTKHLHPSSRKCRECRCDTTIANTDPKLEWWPPRQPCGLQHGMNEPCPGGHTTCK